MGWRTALAHKCYDYFVQTTPATMQTPYAAYDQSGYLAGNQFSYGAAHKKCIELIEQLAKIAGAKEELLMLAKVSSSLARKVEDSRLRALGCFEE